MSHIPSSAMPHAHAQDDDATEAQASQPAGERPVPELAAATPHQSEPAIGDGAADEPPLASAGPGTATGARAGSDADATERGVGGAAAGGQSGVDGTVTPEGHAAPGRGAEDNRRSPALIAAMVLGGLAALGGLVAAALPLLRDDGARKGKKGKKRKARAAA